MVAWTSEDAGVKRYDLIPNVELKTIVARLPAGFVNGTDTFSIDLTKFGGRYLFGALMFEETTAGSITLQSAVSATLGGAVGFTTAVVSGVLTITPLLPANTCITNFVIFTYP